MPEQTRSSGGAGVEGTYGPAPSGNAADAPDAKPAITRSSGGAGVDGSYGPSFSMNTSTSKKESTSTQPAQQEGGTETGQAQRQSEGAGAADPPAAKDAGQAEANLPDPMVAADDGSQPHDATAADLPGRMDVGDGNSGTRSKL